MAVLSCLRFVKASKMLFRNNQRVQEPFRMLRTRRANDKRHQMNFAPEVLLETPREGRMLPGLAKSVFFTLGFTTCTFTGAAIWQYENLKAAVPKSFHNWVQSNWDHLQGWENKEGDLRKALNKWWNGLSPELQVFWRICALNVGVFACWYHPAMKSTMYRFFCSTPAAWAVCWPMVLSTFSHVAPLHLFFNMYCLHSFCHGMSNHFGKEQFLAFYLTGGIMASLMSNIFKVGKGMVGPTLGASGAILALVGYFCVRNKDARLGIIFVPQFNFPAESVIKVILCFDIAGVLFGWRLLDHAAHLGGTLFGISYALFGQKYIWNNRDYIVKHWQNLRSRWKDD